LGTFGSGWPVLEEDKLIKNDFELVLQVNGKIRKKIEANVGLAEEAAKTMAMEHLNEFIAGKDIVKVIYVQNKLVNVVIKG
jgi:leucyl-tRNA synthetase